ncbi:MAG: hypothetical protein IJ374_02110 [Lachnospiraceae bacterium]|nr:hypothetical protein [Lachnospiraceae bacterium]
MKEKQNKRWGLKLVSILGAFLVWLAVVNVADPVMSDTVEVPIEIVNGNVLEENGLTYEIIGRKTATVSYEVNTTNAYRIRSSDFRAYADLTELWSVTGSVPVKVEILNNSEYIKGTPASRTSTIKIETEPLQKKRFDLNTVLVGEVGDGYKVGEIRAVPNHVYVEGPESLIGQISSAGIEMNIDGITADMTGEAEINYYDANGNKIRLSDRVSANYESAEYNLQVLKVKDVALDFEVTGTVADRFRFTGVEADRRNVEVIGMKSVLASLNTITISGDELNIEGADGNIEKTIDLLDYLPEGVTLAGNDGTEVNVILTVERLEDRVYTIEVNESCFVGENEEYTYVPEPDSINVRVRALEEELDALTLDTSDLEIDVSEMEEGLNGAKVVLKTELDPVYEVVYVTICNIHMTKKEAEGPGAGFVSGTKNTEAETSEASED